MRMRKGQGQGHPTEAGREIEWLYIPWLRIWTTPITAFDVVNWIGTVESEKRLLLNHNLHSVYLHATQDQFRSFYERADVVAIDGAPILGAASVVSKRLLNSSLRIGSTDWLSGLAASPSPLRIFVFGATKESNDACVSKLKGDLPLFHVEGLNGYVEDEQALRAIKLCRPDLVIVGRGMPMQEQFIQDNWSDLPNAVYATVGGAIDYVAGTVRLAPRWMGQLGIEWLWRFAFAPRRLWYRYLIEPFKLLLVLVANSRRPLTIPPREYARTNDCKSQ